MFDNEAIDDAVVIVDDHRNFPNNGYNNHHFVPPFSHETGMSWFFPLIVVLGLLGGCMLAVLLLYMFWPETFYKIFKKPPQETGDEEELQSSVRNECVVVPDQNNEQVTVEPKKKKSKRDL
ncbi:hypothetical protein RF11_09698 [Thelohanellus kitauei]|uniref:Uncharacterized protein n=1 Tax=Thelohanellus kitauei TaxID=669202 RepID=A0A0C2N218_THEKT|nr:hypothetical protein RF11_09698 [Thelohanellus kitauei]